MSLLVRKVEKAKWLQNNILEGAEVSADAITNCMKTTMNTLSVFEIPDEAAVGDAILAMATGFTDLDAIDVAILPYTDITNAGLSLKETQGGIRVQEFAKLHRDIVALTYTSLGTVAKIIVDAFKQERVKRFTKTGIRDIVRNALESGRLNKNDFTQTFQREF